MRSKKNLESILSSIFFVTVALCILAIISFRILRPVAVANKWIAPYSPDVLLSVSALKNIEEEINDKAYDGTSLRTDITELLMPVNITSFATRGGKDRLMGTDIKGLVRMEDIPGMLEKLNGEGLSVKNLKLSSRLNFNVAGQKQDASDVVFDLSMTIDFVKKVTK